MSTDKPIFGWKHDPSWREDEVLVGDYDPSWPQRYESWRAKIAPIFGDLAKRIEHFGSSSVPGLAGRDVIDIIVVVDDLALPEGVLARLREIGFDQRRELPHGRFFLGVGNPRTCHLHIDTPDSPAVAGVLQMRDYLRAHPDKRDEYDAWKRKMAASNPAEYQAEKRPYTAAIREAAAAWDAGRTA